MGSRSQTFGIAAAGIIGVAIELERNTYRAPQKFLPIISENLSTSENTVFRRVLRGTVDPVGVKPGDESHEGTVQMEFLHDAIPYFLHAMRGIVTKGGSGSDRTYKIVGGHEGSAGRYGQTLSITIVRNNIVFGYTGIVVGSLELGITDGLLTATMSVMATDEEEQSTPTATFSRSVPFGAGEYDLQIPTDTQIYDADTFSIEINDNPESQHRLQDERRGPWFIKYGEREVTANIDRDFDSREQFDIFKDVTEQSITLRAVDASDPDRFVSFNMPECYVDDFEVSLSGSPGDLVRATTSYMGVHNDTLGAAYELTIGTNENIYRPPAPPSTITAGSLATTTAVITYNASADNGVDGYEYQIRNKTTSAASYPAWAATDVDINSASSGTVNLTGLTANRDYQFRMRSQITDSGVTTKGGWSDPVSFTTLSV